MEMLRSKIIGTPVVDDHFVRPITTIKEVIIDPESGKVIGFLVDLVKNLMVSPIDVLTFGNVLKIHDSGDIVECEDILRVKTVMEEGILVNGSKVESEEGENLGKVTDYVIDGKALKLKKIYTAKVILGLLQYDSRIINEKDIVEILPGKIVVKDSVRKAKEKAPAQTEPRPA